MRLLTAVMLLFSGLMLLGQLNAFYNLTYINTTLILNKNGSTHVIENFYLYVSNDSIQQYIGSRDAIGLSLSYWQTLLYTSDLTEHIVNQHHSAYDFTFLPGPLIKVYRGGDALLTMNYNINNVTTIQNIAPRKFEYTFNSSVFNFEHTANGQALPAEAKLNIIIPSDAYAVSIYPLPDSPPPSFINNYVNVTEFSWDSGEPLSQFTFTFIVTQSLQDEVLTYLSGTYSAYKAEIYLAVVLAVALVIFYVYVRREGSEIFNMKKRR